MNQPGKNNLLLGEIIRLCQLAIRKDNRNGDAHVMLANSYFALARYGGSNNLDGICSSKAGAVMYRWKTSQLPTTNPAMGERTYQEVLTYLTSESSRSIRSWVTFLDGQYVSAVNPDDFSDPEKIIKEQQG